ncbi:MAG: hypothetical protein M1318_03410 [Firmicutes bacterium]|nr:hypothetical protein [Bacillota bacterium]
MAKKPGLTVVKPAKAGPDVQHRFLDTPFNPVCDEDKAGRRPVFFVDSAHLVLDAWFGYLRCLTRVLLPPSSGRHRVNVLGALHAVTHEGTNDTYITSDSGVKFLKNLAERLVDWPITLVLNNTR